MAKKTYLYQITQNQAHHYIYSNTQNLYFSKTSKNTTYQNTDYQHKIYKNIAHHGLHHGLNMQVSYSHYYDWLKQHETTLVSSTLTNTHSLELTNKHLIVKQPNKKLHYPLHTVSKINLAFKRLLLPIIGGGISTPLFTVALWNHLLHFWFGIGIIMAGLSLLYYGWLGTHQLSIQINENQVHYFADQKTPELEKLVSQVNKVIRERNEK